MNLKISQPAIEGIYQGSKFLKFQVLCGVKELESLFEKIAPFSIYPLKIVAPDEIPIPQEMFLKAYGEWIEGLKEGRIPQDGELRPFLAAAITKDEESLWLQPVPNNRYIVKMARPVVQVQAHYFTYSSIDSVFRPMSMGPDAIFWGLQFSYPQIYQHPKTMELLEVEEGPDTDLFLVLRKWVRDETRATPFVVDGKRINATIRLGKSCFSWIEKHPQLIKRGIGIHAG
ncbi:MAG: hypothetical protein A3E80_03190 [Chlamydiae bacterium RIFCSPHIGHO2_12_FULL_49_9]|nr:MAG: hypothetical protein A3E80_03190 [Chlamydiae bacterium RIFCSPHIGHO2_12_FULL_49_9]